MSSQAETTVPRDVCKVVVELVNHDNLTDGDIRSVIEGTEYPNHCMYPHVYSIERRRIGYHDGHPINNSRAWTVAFAQLFTCWQPMETVNKNDRILLLIRDQHGNLSIFDAHYSDGAPCSEATYPAHEPGWYYNCGHMPLQLVPGQKLGWMSRPDTNMMAPLVQQVMGTAHPLDTKTAAKIEF